MHVREPSADVPGERAAKDLQQDMLGRLLIRLGEGVAGPRDGADSSMGSTVEHGLLRLPS